MEIRDFDVVVVGGGLVGCSLACALAPLGLAVGLVDAGSGPTPLAADPRKLALAAASLNALGRLGVLARLATPPTPIERLQVSREGDFGVLNVAAHDVGRAAFGGVVLAGDLGSALLQAVGALPDLVSVRGTATAAGMADDGRRMLDVRGGIDDPGTTAAASAQRWRARLVVAADGSHSPLRVSAGIDVDTHDYGQTLIVTSVRMGAATPGTAYERLTSTGPCALLPMAGGRHGALMGVATDEADAVMALDDRAFAEAFQRRAGWRAGAVREVGSRSAWPLRRLVAKALVAERLVLVGNAAQTIHPIGAQGFNLGLRDALSLVDVLAEARACGTADAGAAAVLSAYEDHRRIDRAETLAFSDGLARATASDSPLHRLGRSLGFAAMSLDAGLRAGFVAGAMGFRGRVPTLARDAA
ncbi:FAD-dependent monooxygenase [Silanimonas sp.]|uniref:FAD-dependent monooxygenase n=1 Tax=Silanimonas sp. TaxID=1929290 RepID=UPI0022C77F53|nr:FAD-dependent monooxygenase [Silanimonas sp.]MCZ8166037.1 FAD-dependent monooxygenase [Silanimonas sp.]